MMRTLNYPVKYLHQKVNLIITDALSQSAIMSPAMNVTNPAMTNRIEEFILKNPDFSNLLPLNGLFGTRNVDIQLTWTAFHRLTAVVRNFKSIRPVNWAKENPLWGVDFESWVEGVFGLEAYGDKPWVIWETPTRWEREWATISAKIDYKKSAWPHGDFVEHFEPCGSCGITITEETDNSTSCSDCGTSIHGNGDCGPWLDTDNYDTVVCVECYEQATEQSYGGYNRLKSNFSQIVAERITDEDIRQTLTFIEETFNTASWPNMKI
jgi:hypothetical protein